MNVVHYRVIFERNPDQEPINDRTYFLKYLEDNFSDFPMHFAGYITPDAKHRLYQNGEPCWQAMIYPDSGLRDIDVFYYFAKNRWKVAGYTICLQWQNALGENEIRFPIHD